MTGNGNFLCARSQDLSSGGHWGVSLSLRSLRDTIRRPRGARPAISREKNMKQKTFNLSLVLILMMAGLALAAAENTPAPAEDTVIRTTVERIDAARDPELLGETTPESELRIAELEARLMEGRQHPKPSAPMETVDLDPSVLLPLNPPVDLRDSDGGVVGPELFVNTNPSNAAAVNARSEVHEPAVAAAGDRVFYTANWYSATSSDGGANFSFVNPSPGPFGAPTGESFCCDQTMAHDPGSNTIFWLQQFYRTGSTDTGTQRINVDQNSDGVWDCAYDINTLLVGFPANTWFDFPDLTVSTNYLYHSSNTFTFSNGWAGGYVGRYPLAELASCSTPLTIDAFTSWDGSFRLSRGADTTMYFATHQSNVALRIWSWPDADSSPTSVTKSIAAWSNGSHSCPGPDGRNWCGRHDGRIQSGFVAGEALGFVWTPSQGGSFGYPYVRISTFDTGDDLAPVDDIDIWSPDLAYMYPSASVNTAGQLGGTVMWGGGATHYPSCSAWVADSPAEGDLVPLAHTLSIAGNYGAQNGDGRSGDYTMSEVYYPDDSQFVGACFAYETLGRGTSTYIRFGRTVATEIFADGFEDGNTAAWSSETP